MYVKELSVQDYITVKSRKQKQDRPYITKIGDVMTSTMFVCNRCQGLPHSKKQDRPYIAKIGNVMTSAMLVCNRNYGSKTTSQ